jgi:hypothetical protein
MITEISEAKSWLKANSRETTSLKAVAKAAVEQDKYFLFVAYYPQEGIPFSEYLDSLVSSSVVKGEMELKELLNKGIDLFFRSRCEKTGGNTRKNPTDAEQNAIMASLLSGPRKNDFLQAVAEGKVVILVHKVWEEMKASKTDIERNNQVSEAVAKSLKEDFKAFWKAE